MKMSDQAQVAIPSISTGSLSLDLALGVGGLPRGRVVEIFGPESSGKTTLVYHVIAEAQRRGGICAFIDAEHAMDPSYARRIGVNIDDLLVSQPDNGEQALEIAELLIRSGALDVVAVDSVAALTPKAEIEGEMGDSHVGLQARLMSQALRKLAGTLNRTGHGRDLHEPAPREDRRHVRQPGDDAGRPRAQVLLVRPPRHAPDRDAQGRRRGDREPRAREGREEQGRAAVQAGRVRHHLRRRHLLGGQRPRRRARAEARAEVRLVLQLRRRAARPGPPERDGFPAGASRTSRTAILRAVQASSGPTRSSSSRLLPVGRRRRGGRRERRTRRRPTPRRKPERRRTGPAPRLAAARRVVAAGSGAPALTALRRVGPGRVAARGRRRRWRTVPDEVVVRCRARAGLGARPTAAAADPRASSAGPGTRGGGASARAPGSVAPRAPSRLARAGARRRESRARPSAAWRAPGVVDDERVARARAGALPTRGWGDAALRGAARGLAASTRGSSVTRSLAPRAGGERGPARRGRARRIRAVPHASSPAGASPPTPSRKSSERPWTETGAAG